MGKLYPRHEKQTRNPAEMNGIQYENEILMSRTQKLKGLAAASLRLRALTTNPKYKIILFSSSQPTVRNNHLTKCQVPLDCARKAVHLLSLVLYQLLRDAQ